MLTVDAGFNLGVDNKLKYTGFTTRLVHSDRVLNTPENGAVHSSSTNSVLFEYQDVQELVDVFQGKTLGHAYARQSCSSIAALQNLLVEMEQGVGALTFSSGMAAITTAFLTLFRAGDHVLLSQYVFGNTLSFKDTLESLGVSVTLVDVTDSISVEDAIQSNTRGLFTETIANPVTQVADLMALGAVCARHGLIYMIDNTMTPSYLFSAKSVTASLVICSLTKYIAGHGNALGGAVIDTGCFDWQQYPNIVESVKSAPSVMWGINHIKKKGLRDMGGCLSSNTAHTISVGMETLALRMERACQNAQRVAEYLWQHPKVNHVYYPGLDCHPHQHRANRLFRYPGAILSVDLVTGCDPHHFLNSLSLVLNATHLGDTRTLGIPVASTIFYESGAALRKLMGVTDSMVRLSIGIEDVDDLLTDFAQALESL